MGKRNRGSTESENEEQRKERKRMKKEAKKQKKKEKHDKAKVITDNDLPSQPLSLPTEDPQLSPADSTVFFRKRIDMTVSLLPSALGDVRANIEKSLNLFLLKYSDGIKGILLAYNNLQITGKGKILNELPYIHYDVSVVALVFCPAVGSHLTGLVTEASFHSHLSLVVYRYFNASIPAEQLKLAGFEFDVVMEQWCWKDEESFTTQPLIPDDSVSFICEKIHESGGIISLLGIKPMRQQRI